MKDKHIDLMKDIVYAPQDHYDQADLSNETIFIRINKLFEFFETCKKHGVEYAEREYLPAYLGVGVSYDGIFTSNCICVMLKGSPSAIEKVKEEWGPEWDPFGEKWE